MNRHICKREEIYLIYGPEIKSSKDAEALFKRRYREAEMISIEENEDLTYEIRAYHLEFKS